jgi:hypothetical protein
MEASRSAWLRPGNRPMRVALIVVAATALVATGCSKARTASTASGGPPLTKVFIQKFRYHGFPATLPTGLHMLYFQNEESFPIVHEMIPIALPAGKTAADVIAAAKANGPASEDGWLHIGGDFGPASTGAGVVETIYLPPGNYAVACWQTGKANGKSGDGPTHVSIGMIQAFTVT